MWFTGSQAWDWGPPGCEAPSSVQTNKGMESVSLMFLFTPLAMCYPMMSSALSTKGTLVGGPATFLFARAWMQWYGGLGIVVLSLALAMPPGIID